MALYHISEDGVARRCGAVYACPLGTLEEHYTTKDEARKAYEARMNGEGHLKGVRREDFQKPVIDGVEAAARVGADALRFVDELYIQHRPAGEVQRVTSIEEEYERKAWKRAQASK